MHNIESCTNLSTLLSSGICIHQVFHVIVVLQKPMPYTSDDTGPWEDILNAMVWLSAATNVLIIGFTRWFLQDYLSPSLRHEPSLTQTSAKPVLHLALVGIRFARSIRMPYLNCICNHILLQWTAQNIVPELFRGPWRHTHSAQGGRWAHVRIRDRIGMVDICWFAKRKQPHLTRLQPLHRVMIEHLLLIFGILTTWLIDPVPQHVKVG